MKPFFLGLLSSILFFPLYSQEKSRIEWTGFVALNPFLDTRDMVTARGGALSLYPKPKIRDTTGANDVYDFWAYQLSPFASRLRCNLFAQPIRCFEIDAAIEGDFLGPTDDTVGAFRLRHAFIKLHNDSDAIFIGQYWHPMRVDRCPESVISINDAAPIDPYARDPQIRWVHRSGTFEILTSMAMQSQGFKSNGPLGYSEDYLRRAVIPNLDFQLGRVTEKYAYGVGVDYKKLIPRVINDFGETIFESVHGVSALAYWCGQFPCVRVSAKFVYGQNVVDLLSIGGYAVTSIDSSTDRRCYTPLQTLHGWLDIAAAADQTWVPGIFLGVVKNIGTRVPIYLNANGEPLDSHGNTTLYGRDVFHNIDYEARISPRLTWNKGTFSVACELQYDRASFGRFTHKATIVRGRPVNNLRVVTFIFYNF